MGVWAAEQVFAKCQDIPWSYKLAFNGTPRPIDDLYGIPDKIFAATTENFSPLTLVKFRRRMCGGTEGVKQFLSHQPSRSLEELGTELKELQKLVKEHKPDVSLTWDKVIVGTQDKIIPTKNQQRYWKETSAHIPSTWLCGYDDRFTILNDELYALPGFPTLYILDEDKRVVRKETSLEAVMQEIARLCVAKSE